MRPDRCVGRKDVPLKNLIESDVHSAGYRRRSHCQSRVAELDGKSYTIVSVFPINDIDYSPESASDKLRYLIESRKH